MQPNSVKSHAQAGRAPPSRVRPALPRRPAAPAPLLRRAHVHGQLRVVAAHQAQHLVPPVAPVAGARLAQDHARRRGRGEPHARLALALQLARAPPRVLDVPLELERVRLARGHQLARRVHAAQVHALDHLLAERQVGARVQHGHVAAAHVTAHVQRAGRKLGQRVRQLQLAQRVHGWPVEDDAPGPFAVVVVKQQDDRLEKILLGVGEHHGVRQQQRPLLRLGDAVRPHAGCARLLHLHLPRAPAGAGSARKRVRWCGPGHQARPELAPVHVASGQHQRAARILRGRAGQLGVLERL
mmetsp:Transcript_38153/g.96545  ORF Transcript_38153/g.96545 Transcript_38153/m.96545 type:complete len:298 (-) Transcript_38153:242-1135(-)